MRNRSRALLFVLLFGPTPSFAQDDKPAPELKAKFHVDLRGAEVNSATLRAMGNGVYSDPAGVRVTLPAGKRENFNPGIATHFKIRGDFEITGTYEILRADRPTEGYGVGVNLWAAIDPSGGEAASLSRRTLKAGTTWFLSNRTNYKGKEKQREQKRESTATSGTLRLKRVGSKIRFLVADGAQAGLVQMAEENFGAEEIRYIQFGANAGNSAAGLDVRMLELTVHAEELPGLVQAAVDVPAPPMQVAAADPAAPKGWLMALLLVGFGVVVICAAALGAGAFLLRRRTAPAPPDE